MTWCGDTVLGSRGAIQKTKEKGGGSKRTSIFRIEGYRIGDIQGEEELGSQTKQQGFSGEGKELHGRGKTLLTNS